MVVLPFSSILKMVGFQVPGHNYFQWMEMVKEQPLHGIKLDKPFGHLFLNGWLAVSFPRPQCHVLARK